MRYRRAIEKIRILAEACENFKRYPSEEPFLRAARAGTRRRDVAL